MPPPQTAAAASAAGAAAAPGGGVPMIGGLSEVVDRYDAFLFDLWGVVHNGAVAFPWAVETLQELRRRGKPVVFLSNSSRRSATNATALARLGVPRELYVDLITSGEEAWKALAESSSELPGPMRSADRVLTFGNGADDVQYLEGLAPRRSAPAEEADLLLARGCSTLCEGDASPRKATWEELERALATAAARNLPMLVANPDVVRPDGADSPMPGKLAQRYVQLGGPEPHFIGKPYQAIFGKALARLEAEGVAAGARVCMVGDSVWHDVRGARAAGLDVVLLCTGVHSKALGLAQAPAAPRRPDAAVLSAFLGSVPLGEEPTCVAAALTWRGDEEAGDGALPPSPPLVVACGGACADMALQVEAFPEPDAKIRASETAWFGGGNASNTAAALARLGTTTAAVTKVGGDLLGDFLVEGLRAEGVDTRAVVRAAGAASACTSVIVDRAGKTRTCIHSPMDEELSGQEAEAAVLGLAGGPSELEGMIFHPTTRHLHLDGRHPEGALALARAARRQGGITISIDVERPRPGLDELLPLCDGIFCNSAFPGLWTGTAGLPGALAGILGRCPSAAFVVATRGERGSLLLARQSAASQVGEAAVAAAGLPVQCCCGSYEGYVTLACDAWPLGEGEGVVDTTGAGDVFIAGFLHAWMAGHPLSLAMANGAQVATYKLRQAGPRLGDGFDSGMLTPMPQLASA